MLVAAEEQLMVVVVVAVDWGVEALVLEELLPLAQPVLAVEVVVAGTMPTV
jgi:hypothetical protein